MAASESTRMRVQEMSLAPEGAETPGAIRRMVSRVGGGRTPAALVDQALVSGANFATNVVLARGLGVREYGIFALAWVAVMFANSLQYALVVTPMMSVGPKQDTEDRPAYFGAVLLQEIGFVLLATLIMLAGVRLSGTFFPEWHVAGLAWPMCGATLAYLLQEFLRRYFFCTRQSKLALVTDVVSYLTQVPVIFWLVRVQRASLPIVLWTVAGTSLVGFLVCVGRYERVVFDQASFRSVSSRHWQMSRWLAPSAFMQWGAGNLFLMAAPVYYGAAASATLRAANNIVGVAHIWFLGLDNVVPAEASRQIRLHGLKGMLRYIRGIFLRWGGVTLVFCAMVAAFPSLWLHLLYGHKYSGDVSVLRLYALLYIFIFVSGPLRAGLQALEYTAPIFWAYPALIAFSVALAGPFARHLGLNGVMLGMCATQVIFQGLIGLAFLLRVRKVRRAEQTEAVATPL